MPQNDNVANIYDCLNQTYENLTNIMGEMDQFLKENPDNEIVRSWIRQLGTVGLNILYSQKELISSYGDESIRSQLVDRITDKENTFSTTLETRHYR